MILIISNTQDITCDLIVRELRRLRTNFARLNTDEFPTQALGIVTAGSELPPRSELRWLNRDSAISFDTIKSVLYRRPVPPIPDHSVTERATRQFCTDESYEFLRGIWLSLDCHWISHPEAIRLAEHKIYQLRAASKLGFRIPRTIITNDPQEIRQFFGLCGGLIIVKPIYLGFIDYPGSPSAIYTSLVSDDDLTEIDLARLAPSIYQEYIDRSFDLRVTVVGRKCFAAKIEFPFSAASPDWRAYDVNDLKHTLHKLPAVVEALCIELVATLNLDFGSIDLIVNRAGDYFFLEINPNGQWAWLETILGLPISQAIATRLIEGANASGR